MDRMLNSYSQTQIYYVMTSRLKTSIGICILVREQFDLSDMKIEKFKDSEIKKVVGKFKDEIQRIPICEFIELRSKMYSLKLDDDSEKKTAKCIVRNVIKNDLKQTQYKQILDAGERMTSSMRMIRSFDHDIYTVNVTKISLSAYDDKRFIQDDAISSYAYGHYATPSCMKQIMDIGAIVKDVEQGAHVKDDDAWLYISYDNQFSA